MSSAPLTPENLSSLIDHVMKSKDPATVGLRRILKKQEEESKSFNYHAPELKEFDIPNAKPKTLDESDTLILELEKKVNNLQLQLKKQEENNIIAQQNAFIKGRDDGFAEGLKKGKADTTNVYEKKIDELQKKINTFLKTIEDSKREIFSNSEHMILRFCTEFTKKIIGCEISTNPDIIFNVIKKAMTFIGDKEKLILRVAPDDFECVSNRKDFWIPVTERLNDVVIEKDDRIEKGGCIIESNSGMADARLGVQFEELTEIIEKTWENINLSNSNDSDTN